jgi:lysophospholipid acyltransferase (LPLAT)-like uncharacterized protein
MSVQRVSLAKAGPSHASLSEQELHRQVYRLSDLSGYSFKDRLIIKTAGLFFYGLIMLIARTVRWTVVHWHHYEEIIRSGKHIIYTFWHNRTFLATWFWRRRGIVVMSSRSFDGECMARCIQRFGYGAARGSPTRDTNRAFLQMVKCMKQGMDTAFTIDGPHGPIYVAKQGATRLAQLTGHVILPFHISAKRYWEIKSWDRFQIPYPFTRAVILLGKPIYVSPEASDSEMAERQAELQATLDELRVQGDRWWSR